MQTQVNPTSFKPPPALKEWLKREAEKNHRSLSSEIIFRLIQSKQQQEGAKQ